MTRRMSEMRSGDTSSPSRRASAMTRSALAVRCSKLYTLKRKPRVVYIIVGDFDVIGDEPCILDDKRAVSADRFRALEKLCGCRLPARAQFVGDLLRAALLLEKLSTGLTRASFGFRRARRIIDEGVNDAGSAYESLLIDRDQLKKRAVRGRSGELRDGFIGRAVVERHGLVNLAPGLGICGEITEHGGGGLARSRKL
jgi:hypothetical protein